MVLIYEDKEYLKYCLEEIEKVLSKYKLEINRNKTIIGNIGDGLEFLGFKFYIKNGRTIVKVKNATKRRFIRRIGTINKLNALGYIDEKEYKARIAGFTGHLKWGDCSKLVWSFLR